MKEILLNDYKKPDFIIPEVNININIFEKETIVQTELTIIRQCEDKTTPLILNGEDLILNALQIDGSDFSDYDYKDNLLTINGVPDSFVLFSEVKIDPINNKSLEGFYKSGDILCSQNEAEGFRRITFFLDRPDVMSKYLVTLEADKKQYPYLLSNGNLIKSIDVDNNRHRNTWQDPFAKPCYLFAVVAGDLELTTDSFKTQSGRTINLEIYTDHGKGSQSIHAMESLKKSMTWDEEVFGLEYDLDIYMIVAVDSFNAGAMENKGLNIFNSKYVLADPNTATDSDFEGVESVIAHEYFHNWTGNRVTCRDWFQLTLKEGLTVFRDHEFSSDMTNRTIKRISDVSILRNHQFPEDKGPNSHPIKPESYIDINNFYTATVYEKGAEIIRMIHTIIGKEKFRDGMDLYFKRHDGDAVTTEDFVAAMADASGIDMTQFKRWYSQAGTPIIDVESSYDKGVFTLKIKQTIPKTTYNGKREPLYIPFNIGLYTAQGTDLTPKDQRTIILTKESEVFTFNTGEKVIPSLLQGYSAPVIVNYGYTTEDLLTLLNFDIDNFNRFDASRRLAMISITNILDNIKSGKESEIDSRIISVYKTLLENKDLEKRYLATLLFIPEVKNIAMLMPEYDFVLANIARTKYLTLLATELKGNLFRIFEDNIRDKYTFNKQAVGERSLKNRSLYILSYLHDDIAQIALKHFETSDNMTDYLAAYSALQMCSDSIRVKANEQFFSKWKDNFLVMNKWFSVQASRDDVKVLEDIKKLSKHPLFDKTNPNSIRSIYGVFSRSNISQFHRTDGIGYEFLADIIIDVDSFNSHISSNMAGAFQDYQYISLELSKLMKVQLTRILEKDKISTGLFEIVSKTLKTRS
ncbi:MAG: aminopeptidase N [Spirochaetaceae bacterium]